MRLTVVGAIAAGMLSLLCWSGTAAASTKYVKAELLANVAQVRPGEPFMLGVRLRLTPKWHVYWSNPGETGLPTEVQFTLPQGFKVGQLLYPIPKRFTQPGDIAGYGYEDEVLLMAEVTPPVEHQGEVTATAQVQWLVCDEVCIPGRTTLSLKLPTGEQATPANEALFATWRARLPLKHQEAADAAPQVQSEAVEGGVRNTVRLTLPEGATGQVEWFEPGAQELLFIAPQVQREGERVELQCTVKPLQGMKSWPAELEGLLVYTLASGERRGVTVPIQAPAPPRAADGE